MNNFKYLILYLRFKYIKTTLKTVRFTELEDNCCKQVTDWIFKSIVL